jgi:hypothetical protein
VEPRTGKFYLNIPEVNGPGNDTGPDHQILLGCNARSDRNQSDSGHRRAERGCRGHPSQRVGFR